MKIFSLVLFLFTEDDFKKHREGGGGREMQDY